MNVISMARDFTYVAALHKAKPLRFEMTLRTMMSFRMSVEAMGPTASAGTGCVGLALLGLPFDMIGKPNNPFIFRLVCEGMTLEARE